LELPERLCRDLKAAIGDIPDLTKSGRHWIICWGEHRLRVAISYSCQQGQMSEILYTLWSLMEHNWQMFSSSFSRCLFQFRAYMRTQSRTPTEWKQLPASLSTARRQQKYEKERNHNFRVL